LGGGKPPEPDRPHYQASVEIAMRHLTDYEPDSVVPEDAIPDNRVCYILKALLIARLERTRE
jgi:hypothetical protein